MKPRPYQEQCCESILEAIANGFTAILCVLFTGAGKTVVFSLLARMCSGSKVLVIAPLRELVWQTAKTADRVTGERTGVEMADQWSSWFGDRVTVASVRSLLSGKPKRYKRFIGVRIVIVDEAHTVYSDAVIAMLQEFRDAGAIVIGFTATPFRQDGRKLMDFYQTVAFDYGLERGIDDGYCLPPRAKIVRIDGLDLSKVRTVDGDFSAEDLDMVLGASAQLHRMCIAIQRERVGAALAFLPRARSAIALAEMASQCYGINAAYIVGNTAIQPEGERSLVINRFRNGEIDLLCNCAIATMGFDAPIARSVFLFRPTKSRVLWKQVIGRVTRPAPGDVDGDGLETAEARKSRIAAGDKPWFKVIDITGSTDNHSIVTAVDMFAREGEDQDVVRAARNRAANDDAQDPADLLAQAAEDVRKAKIIEAGLRAMHGQASGDLKGRDVDLVRKKDISEYRNPLRGRFGGRPMGELDDGYIAWAIRNPSVKGWQRSFFVRERARRDAVGRNS